VAGWIDLKMNLFAKITFCRNKKFKSVSILHSPSTLGNFCGHYDIVGHKGGLAEFQNSMKVHVYIVLCRDQY